MAKTSKKFTSNKITNNNITKKNITKKNITKKNIIKKNIYKLKGNELILRKECFSSIKPIEENINKNKKYNKNLSNKEFVKLLLSKFSPSHIKPEDDYYDYINYKWLQNISLKKEQKYITQIDEFRLTQDKVYHELYDIAIDYINKNSSSRKAKNMGNFINSVLKMNPTKNTKELSKQLAENVEQLFQENNPWKILAHFNTKCYSNYRSPFVFNVSADEKDSKVFRVHIEPHQFELVDLNVYFKDGENVKYKKNYINKYKLFCKKLFALLLGNNHGYDTDGIFDVEVEIMNSLGCFDIVKDDKSYNKVLKNESKEKYGFDFVQFAKFIGFKTVPDFFITSSINYLKCGTDLLLKNWKTSKWKAYWVYINLASYCRFTKGWESLYYDFFGKFERGQEKINKTDAVSASLYMSMPFNKFFTEKYVEVNATPEKINYVNILANDLKEVFIKIISQNKWLHNSTRNYAIEKLKKIKFTIGFPDKLLDDPDIDYNRDLLIENMDKISEYYHTLYVSLEGKEVIDLPNIDFSQYPVKFIGDQAYIVNASYTPSKNGIYINLGYMQKPFIDLDERGIEYNLAHIGFTLGHEMSHSLDDWGSKYDADGNLYDWWTASDKAKYKKIQNDVINQYTKFAARDGIHFDASIGIGEDLADISGLEICNKYLKDFQDNNNDIIPIRMVSYETFYIYYALQQRQKIVKRALSSQLKTNPHPLDKYRCNIPLSRSSIFRGVFDVKKYDDMWWHNTNTVWSNE